MAVSLAAKIILVTAICFSLILITLIVTIVMVTNSQDERNQNQSMSLRAFDLLTNFGIFRSLLFEKLHI